MNRTLKAKLKKKETSKQCAFTKSIVMYCTFTISFTSFFYNHLFPARDSTIASLYSGLQDRGYFTFLNMYVEMLTCCIRCTCWPAFQPVDENDVLLSIVPLPISNPFAFEPAYVRKNYIVSALVIMGIDFHTGI